MRNSKNYLCDSTHVNSFFQITKNPISKKIPAFVEGNWLVNFSFTGYVLIFDRDFKKVLWHRNIELPAIKFHDIQSTPEGKILLYVNNHFSASEPKRPYSAIAEIDPLVNGKEAIKVYDMKYQGKKFYQALAGGMQLLPNQRKLASVYTPQEGQMAAYFDKNWNVEKIHTQTRSFWQRRPSLSRGALNQFKYLLQKLSCAFSICALRCLVAFFHSYLTHYK